MKEVVERGRSVADVAKGLGIQPNMLYRWKAELESGGRSGAVAFPGNGNPSANDEEVRRLAARLRLATAEQERDILKNAVAFFAKTKC